MKTKLSKTWMPSDNVLTLAKSKGMPIEDWLYHLIPEWKLYWLERNVLRCWNATFWNHAKSEWLKVDKSRMYRDAEDLEIDKTFDAIERNIYRKTNHDALSIERFNQQVEDYFK